MLRQLLKRTESRLVLELPAEFIGQAIEILAFPVENTPKLSAESADLPGFANHLRERLGQPAETPNWPPEIMAFEGMPDMPAFESHRQALEVGLIGLRNTPEAVPGHEWRGLRMPVRNAINQLNPPPEREEKRRLEHKKNKQNFLDGYAKIRSSKSVQSPWNKDVTPSEIMARCGFDAALFVRLRKELQAEKQRKPVPENSLLTAKL